MLKVCDMSGLLRCLILLAAFAAVLPASAAGFDVAFGPSITAEIRTTSAIFASVYGESAFDNSMHIEPIASLGWVQARNDGKLYNQSVLLVGGGVRFITADGHWFISEQLAATNGRTNPLSSAFEFMTSVGWQYKNFVIKLRHISNGFLVGGGENEGETMLLIGMRW